MGQENDMATSHNEVKLYSKTFWSVDMAAQRKMLLQTLFLPLLYTSILMWGCLSLYWGSLLTNDELDKLDVLVVNKEDNGGLLGPAIVAGTASQAGPNSLHWVVANSMIPGYAEERVRQEAVWAAVEVSANASSSLSNALATGDALYDPTNAITLFYASARNQITANSHVVPAVLSVINPILSAVATHNTAALLGKNIHNTTAIEGALGCPQCLTIPFVLKSVDLVPFDSPTATGSVMVGMIFLLTFTFQIFQILRTSGVAIGAKLRLSSAISFRAIASLGAYLIMSLWFTLVNLAFGVPMNGTYGEGAGFMVYWMLNWCTMAAVGLVMESLFTLIGMKWAGYFLSFWIIVNVSGAFASFAIMPDFYQYGYAFPFHHSIQGARTIIFGTKSHLGLNFGVLIVWSIVSLAGLCLFMSFRARRNVKSGEHNVL